MPLGSHTCGLNTPVRGTHYGLQSKLTQAGERFESLRRPPIIDHRYLLRARDRAPRGAMLLGLKLAAAVCDRVPFEGNAGITTLLRAPVHQPVLTNIQVA